VGTVVFPTDLLLKDERPRLADVDA
jgi:hypothetical protein